jgi:DNA repair exonuclease SbcCD ATPase subunit
MKATLAVIAILAAGAGSYLAFDYSKKFEVVNTVLEQLTADIKKNEAATENKEKDIKAEEEKLAAAEGKQATLKQQVDDLTSKSASLKNETVKAERELKGQEAEFGEVQKAIDEVKLVTTGLDEGITIENLPDKIKTIEAEVAEKAKKTDELKALVSGASVSIAANKTEAENLQKQLKARADVIRRNSFQAVVSAVNQDLGFVVIGAGARSGLVANAELIIVRDGRAIGRVKPTSIEPSQTIADIDMDSLASGVRIQAGDRVILAKPN